MFETGAVASDAKVLARGTACDNIDRRDFCPVDLCNVSKVFHPGITP